MFLTGTCLVALAALFSSRLFVDLIETEADVLVTLRKRHNRSDGRGTAGGKLL